MESETVVLTDNSAIIGASCSQESQYASCRPLFDYFKRRPVGVVTNSIKDSVKRRVSKMPNLLSENMQALDSNLRVLRTEEIDYTKAEGHIASIQGFYSSLPSMIKEYIAFSKREAEEKFQARMNNVPGIFRRCVRDCYKLQTAKEYPPYSRYVEKTLLSKFFDSPPSVDDVMLLAEACQLKESYENVLVASADHHFSPITSFSGVVETFVPSSIEEKFQIKCDWPNAILQALKKR